jgi:hypothetical protein
MLKPFSIAILALALVVSPAVSKDGDNGGGKGGDSGGGKGGDGGGGKGGDSGGGGTAPGGSSSGGSTGGTGGGSSGGSSGSSTGGGAASGGGVSGGGGSTSPGGVGSGGSNPSGGVNAGGSSSAGTGGSGVGNSASSRGGTGAGLGSSVGALGGPTFGHETGLSLGHAVHEGRGGGEVSLPPSLSPVGRVMLSWPEQPRALEPLRSRPPGMAPRTVRACRTAIVAGARRHGAVRVDVASAGPTRSRPTGALMAPIEVRIVYERKGQAEVRQARVTCQLDATGQVFALR